jgi:radical SAM superfamily enzyme YgiQ (UPF0313 family)
MRVTLVQPPSNRYDTSELAPPVSLLTVGAVLEEDDVDVRLVDLNVMGLVDPGFVDGEFYRKAVECIAATDPDVVGFTSMALESHVCLELGRLLKTLDPSVQVVMGGPHFSAIAAEVLEFYPWVDYVVLGEGELPARTLLRYLRGKAPISAFSNIAYRRNGEIVLKREFKPYSTLNDLPFPAYHMVDLEEYFRLNPYRVLDIEHARGCMLRCAFCYSPVHWGQGEQTKRIDRIVEDVHRHYELGARHLFFVADNFANSKPFAKALSDAIADANPGLTWRCYATLAQLTDDLLDSMAKSACTNIFIGVDAVSDDSKKRFHKTYFKGWPSLRSSLERCLDRGITPACAFMLNPPDGDIDDTEVALGAAVHAYNLDCSVRLNPLTIYAGTGLEAEARRGSCAYSDAKAKMLLDGHWVTQVNDYARERPWLFPFHSTVGPPESYDRFIAATHMCFTLLDNFPRTLMQWLHFEEAPLWQLVTEAVSRTDYRSLNKNDWRVSEAEAFAEVLTQRRLSPSVRDTLTFEITEHRLRRPANDREVRVSVDDTALDFDLGRHAVINLTRPPTSYETTEAKPTGPEADRTYLLVPQGMTVRYLEPDRPTVELLDRIGRAAARGQPISAPAGGVTALMAANVLKLPQPVTDSP